MVRSPRGRGPRLLSNWRFKPEKASYARRRGLAARLFGLFDYDLDAAVLLASFLGVIGCSFSFVCAEADEMIAALSAISNVILLRVLVVMLDLETKMRPRQRYCLLTSVTPETAPSPPALQPKPLGMSMQLETAPSHYEFEPHYPRCPRR